MRSTVAAVLAAGASVAGAFPGPKGSLPVKYSAAVPPPSRNKARTAAITAIAARFFFGFSGGWN